MIKSIKVTNYRNESLTLELANPYKTGLAITSVDGLGPAEASISTSDIASKDGSLFNSARMGNRNIVLNFRLLPNPAVEAIRDVERIRHTVYRYFPIKKKLTLEIITGERIGTIVGYVDKCEPNIFTKNQTIQVSIVCPDPWFKSSEEIKINSLQVTNAFNFPLESIMTERKNLLDLSNCVDYTIDDHIAIHYEKNEYGDVEYVSMIAIKPVNKNSYPRESIIIFEESELSFNGFITLEKEQAGELNNICGEVAPSILVEMIMPGGAMSVDFYDTNATPGTRLRYSLSLVRVYLDMNNVFYNHSEFAMGVGESIKFYPMLRDIKYESDRTFEPYIPADRIEDTAKYLHFGFIEATDELRIDNTGDSETGINIVADLIGEVTNLMFAYDDTVLKLSDEVINNIAGSNMKDGDKLIIDSRKGSKKVSLFREGTEYNIIGAITEDSDWIILEPGMTVIKVSADENDTSSVYNAHISTEINKLFEGV